MATTDDDAALVPPPPRCGNNNPSRDILMFQQPLDNNSFQELLEEMTTSRSAHCGIIGGRFLEGLSDTDLSNFYRALLLDLPALQSLNCLDLSYRSFSALVGSLRRYYGNHNSNDSKAPNKSLTQISILNLQLLQSNNNDETDDARSFPVVDDSLRHFVDVLLSKSFTALASVDLNMLAPDDDATDDVESSITATLHSTTSTGFTSSSQVVWNLDLYSQFIPLLLLEIFQCHNHQDRRRFSSAKLSGVDAAGIATRTIGQILRQQNCSLDKLQLSMDVMHADGSLHLASALEGTNQRLRELSIQLLDDGNHHHPSSHHHNNTSFFQIAPLAGMLRTNTCLEWLELSRNLWHDETACALAQGLKQNETLKVLLVSLDDTPDDGPVVSGVTTKGYKALLEMLTVNQAMEVLPTLGLLDDSPVRSKIDLYLKLNEHGVRRVRLSMNTNHEAFLDVLETEGEDLDCIYYLLSMNPLLFNSF